MIDRRNHPDPGRLFWSARNSSAGILFIKHTLAITDFAVKLRATVARYPQLTLIDGDDLIAQFPEKTRDSEDPLKWTVTCNYNGDEKKIPVVPDYAFVLDSNGKRRGYLVEIDRGSMPVERRKLTQTSLLRKCLAYVNGHAQELHKKHFGWSNFNTLIVTTSETRADNVRDLFISRSRDGHSKSTLATHLKTKAASDRFLITDHASLIESDNMLAHPWLTTNPEACLVPSTFAPSTSLIGTPRVLSPRPVSQPRTSAQPSGQTKGGVIKRVTLPIPLVKLR